VELVGTTLRGKLVNPAGVFFELATQLEEGIADVEELRDRAQEKVSRLR
jgi:hypothetical protein